MAINCIAPSVNCITYIKFSENHYNYIKIMFYLQLFIWMLLFGRLQELNILLWGKLLLHTRWLSLVAYSYFCQDVVLYNMIYSASQKKKLKPRFIANFFVIIIIYLHYDLYMKGKICFFTFIWCKTQCS